MAVVLVHCQSVSLLPVQDEINDRPDRSLCNSALASLNWWGLSFRLGLPLRQLAVCLQSTAAILNIPVWFVFCGAPGNHLLMFQTCFERYISYFLHRGLTPHGYDSVDEPLGCSTDPFVSLRASFRLENNGRERSWTNMEVAEPKCNLLAHHR